MVVVVERNLERGGAVGVIPTQYPDSVSASHGHADRPGPESQVVGPPTAGRQPPRVIRDFGFGQSFGAHLLSSGYQPPAPRTTVFFLWAARR